MARLAGVDIPREKRVEIALTYIYGVGRTRALTTLAETGIDGNIRVKDLSDEQLVALRDYIEAARAIGERRSSPSPPMKQPPPIAAESDGQFGVPIPLPKIGGEVVVWTHCPFCRVAPVGQNGGEVLVLTHCPFCSVALSGH